MPPTQGKDGYLREEMYQGFTGLDTTSSPSFLDPKNLRVAKNVNLTRTGAIELRSGYTSILSGGAWTGTTIKYGTEVFSTLGVPTVFVWGTTSASGAAKLGTVNTGTWTVSSVETGLSDNRPCILSITDRYFFFNGAVNKWGRTGAFVGNMLLEAPTNAPTGVSNTNGSLTVGASYLAAYTYYNSTTGDESSPSPISSGVVVGADPNDGITWTVSAYSGTGSCDKIRVYRTVANGNILYLDQEISSASTSVTSTQVDSGLGVELELDNTPLSTWGYPRYATIINNRIYTTGFSGTANDRVRWSKIGKVGTMPLSYQAREFSDCRSSFGFGDTNIGIGSANEIPIILKKKSVGKLVSLGSSGGDSGITTNISEYREISGAVTAVSHWASGKVFTNFVWLGTDNVYMTDGNEVVAIADKISTTISALNFKYPESLSFYNDLQNKRIYISVISGIESTPNTVLVGHYRNFPEFHWTMYTQGDDIVTYPGIQPGCFFDITDTTNNTKSVVFGNIDFSGKLYKMNTGTNDDTKAIWFDTVFAPIAFQYPEEFKLFKKVILHFRTENANVKVMTDNIFDLNDETAYSSRYTILSLVSPDITGAIWDSSLFDSGVFAPNNTTIRLQHDVHQKAYYYQLRVCYPLTPGSAEISMVIYGFTIMARPSTFR